jgi:myo-inositol-1(or 4)-monophosphatase
VAQGQIDGGYAGGNSKDWDLAAADLLVHEAGGLLTSLAGEAVLYNQPNPAHVPLVAAGRLRSPALCKLLAARPA